MTLQIRPFESTDWPQVWAFLAPVLRAGETYSFAMDMTEAAARQAWIDAPSATFVAVDATGECLGLYYIKPNQPGQGAHVCNCGYVTAEAARGRGVASALCAHSMALAPTLGFRAMQYNLVVATNTVAVRLWQKHGMQIVATLPGAYRHATLGFVDAHVMYRSLVETA